MSTEHRYQETPDFILEAHEMGTFWKAVTLWWLTPKHCVLRRIELRGGNVDLEMWDGTRHAFALDDAKITWQKHQNGHRIIFVKNLADNSKFRIVEFALMLPNEENDFTQLMNVMNAQQSLFYRVAKHFIPSPLKRVLDQLGD